MHRINAFNLKTQEIHHYLLEMRNDGKYLCCLYTLGKQVLFVSVVVFYATQIYRILPTLKSQVTVDLIMFPRVPNADQVRMDDKKDQDELKVLMNYIRQQSTPHTFIS